ncbi:unnamed protein product [Allacma fusca]|uniref:Uncharacterized protein n=1 Tax=Allacma fusca TaxID=39272 RepID=A0A8J2NSH0_9HEXA|nr:unnamed protein product [Allacma fusca]
MSYLTLENTRSRSRAKTRDEVRSDVHSTPSANRNRPMTAVATTTIPPAGNNLSRAKNAEFPEDLHFFERNKLQQRPKTSVAPQSFNLSGLADRFCFGVTNQRELSNVTSSDLYERKHEILGNGVNAYYPEWSLYNNASDGRVESDEGSSAKCYRWEGSKNCDLEFMNEGFRYADDDSMSVSELQMEKDYHPVKARGIISEGGDDNTKPGTLKKFMTSVLSMHISQKLFGESGIPSVNLLSSAAKVGEQIYRAGLGVANALFSEQEAVRDDYITYNGYKIHTLGNNICINSVILRGPKDQKLRVVVQTKDTDELDSRAVAKYKCEPRIYINDGKWTLIHGCFEEEGTGTVEIELPPGLSLSDITSEGTFNGFIFIDLP